MLASTSWLAAHTEDPDLVVVDMRWRGDGSGRTLWKQSHLPGAVHLDWSTDLVDTESDVAYTLAPPDVFAAAMARSGIGEDTTVVAYTDQLGSGPHRLWWACRVYGHDGVRILDGGLEKWLAEGRPLSSERPERRPPPRPWIARPTGRFVADASDVRAARHSNDVVVLDSRPADQYRGEAVWFELGPVPAGIDGIAHTPRGDLRTGHVPWASSVPSAELYREDCTMKSAEELRSLFVEAGVGEAKRAITYCGCGISASALLYALSRAGIHDVALYDASWEEWGRDPEAPIAREL
jgi:thiosulfate/3-mercaptopyruvate sulfurtransferase